MGGRCPVVYRNARRSSISSAVLPLGAGRNAASIRQSRNGCNTPPVGQITSPPPAVQLWLVQSPFEKYFCFSEMQIELHDLPSRPARGALAIVTNVGTGSGGRGSARAHRLVAGRVLSIRERSIGERRRTVLLRTAKSCGPDASAVGVKSRGGFASPTGWIKPYSRGDGVKQARSPGRARSKP